MAITKEGDYRAQITAADIIDPRFQDVPQPAFEIMLTVKTEHGEDGQIFLEFSRRSGQGNMASKTQTEISMESLTASGWAAGADFSRLPEMVGKVINVRTHKNTKGYINLYISTFATTKISPAEAAARVSAMTGAAPAASPSNPFGGGAAAPANPFAQTPATPANPFAREYLPR